MNQPMKADHVMSAVDLAKAQWVQPDGRCQRCDEPRLKDNILLTRVVARGISTDGHTVQGAGADSGGTHAGLIDQRTGQTLFGLRFASIFVGLSKVPLFRFQR
ncbi:MAG: hypothetical protein IPH43_04020 [Xanthomonadales bacterium]|nr:hypothetical protein [Xanthomonadales bacterium]